MMTCTCKICGFKSSIRWKKFSKEQYEFYRKTGKYICPICKDSLEYEVMEDV